MNEAIQAARETLLAAERGEREADEAVKAALRDAFDVHQRTVKGRERLRTQEDRMGEAFAAANTRAGELSELYAKTRAARLGLRAELAVHRDTLGFDDVEVAEPPSSFTASLEEGELSVEVIGVPANKADAIDLRLSPTATALEGGAYVAARVSAEHPICDVAEELAPLLVTAASIVVQGRVVIHVAEGEVITDWGTPVDVNVSRGG